jgi:L-amino acid N-acyltransferase YncA
LLEIIEARGEHMDAIWDIFHEVVKSGDTYVYAPQTTKDEALAIWCADNVKTFVALSDGLVVGTYIIKANFPGLGSHVSNCSYMVSSKARGLGVGRAMAEHSLKFAKESGFLGMQFNIVVSTNESAVRLWKALGFAIIGTTPKGFQHATLGLVDTFAMYREL